MALRGRIARNDRRARAPRTGAGGNDSEVLRLARAQDGPGAVVRVLEEDVKDGVAIRKAFYAGDDASVSSLEPQPWLSARESDPLTLSKTGRIAQWSPSVGEAAGAADARRNVVTVSGT